MSGSVQTFIPVSILKDYTEQKPGYRAAFGYTFFRAGKHTIPVYIEAGHSTVLGTNPLVRSFDSFPVTINAAYEYFPIQYFSLGVFAGAGIGIARIQHYPVALDLLSNKLQTTTGTMPVINTGLTVGTAMVERSIELKARFSAELMIEKARLIPFPSFQLAVRVYPGAVYAYAQKKQAAERNEKEYAQILAAAAEQAAAIPEQKPLEQFSTLYIYFEPESAELDVNAKGDIKKAAAILKEHSSIFVLFESSTAPFGQQSERFELETARIRTVADYLKQKCGITQDRIIYNEPKEKNYQIKNSQDGNDYYIQYRYVKIRFVRVQGNPDEEVNVYRQD